MEMEQDLEEDLMIDGVGIEDLDDELLLQLLEGTDLEFDDNEHEELQVSEPDIPVAPPPSAKPPPVPTTFTINRVEPKSLPTPKQTEQPMPKPVIKMTVSPPSKPEKPKETLIIKSEKSDSESDLEIVYSSTKLDPIKSKPKPTEPKVTIPKTEDAEVTVIIPKTEQKPDRPKSSEPPLEPIPHHSKSKDKDKEKKKKSHHYDLSSTPEARLKTKTTRDPDFLKYKNKFNLLNTSCTIIEIGTIINLKRHMRLRAEKLQKIENIDRQSQIRWNNKNKRIRLINSFKPASGKHNKDSKKDKKKHKKVYIASDSDDDNSSKSSNSGPPPPKKEKLDKSKTSGSSHAHANNSKDLYTSTGARILPFEKKHKELVNEQNRIRRPKMPEPEETQAPSKRLKDRDFGDGAKRSKALDKMLAQAAKATANNNFKIPRKESAVRPEREPQQPPPPSTSSYRPPSVPVQIVRPHAQNFATRGGGAGGSRPWLNQRGGMNTRLPYRSDRPIREDFNSFQNRRPYDFPQENYSPSPWHRQEGEQPIEPSRPQRPPPERNERNSYGNRHRQPQQPQQDDPPPHMGMDDMHDEPGSDNDEATPPRTPPPPITEPILGFLAQRTAAYLARHPQGKIDIPEQQGNAEIPSADILAKKVAAWFRRAEKEKPTALKDCPEDFDFIFNLPPPPAEDGMSEFGNVSNPDGDSEELTEADLKRQKDADVLDEFAGASLLNATYRVGTYAEERFQKIFELRPGSGYEKSNFQARCTICDYLVQSTRQLGIHVRSETHRQNFKLLFENLVQEMRPGRGSDRTSSSKSKDEERDRVPRDPSTLRLDKFIDKLESDKRKSKPNERSTSTISSTSKNGAYSPTQSVENLSIVSLPKSTTKTPVSKSRGNGRKSRSRSRDRDKKRERDTRPSTSRHNHRRSRSPSSHRQERSRERDSSRRDRDRGHRSRSREGRKSSSKREKRETSAERVAKFLEKTNSYNTGNQNFAPKAQGIKSIFPEILKLQACGKWDPLSEAKYKRMELEEKEADNEMQQYRVQLTSNPETHPTYQSEWDSYWQRKYQEVEADGLDPNKYDYVPGWKAFWSLRIKEIIQQKHERLVLDIRKNYGFDDYSIQRLLSAPDNSIPPLPPVPLPLPPFQPPPPSHSVSDHYCPTNHIQIQHHQQLNPMDDMTTRSMSLASFDGSLESGEVKSPMPVSMQRQSQPQPQPNQQSTLQSLSSAWENLTGQKIVMPGTNPTTSTSVGSNGRRPGSVCSIGSAISSAPISIGSTQDVDSEVDILQLLQKMSGLSDQLSILSSQVQNYCRKAEDLERQEPKKAKLLLDEKEFCLLLINCRKRFTTLLIASNQPRETHKLINKVVYSLNDIIGSEPCSKWIDPPKEPAKGTSDKPKPNAINLPNPPIQSSSSQSIPTPPQPPLFSIPPGLPTPLVPKVKTIQTTLRGVPLAKRQQIAQIISSNLAASEIFHISETDLVDNLSDILKLPENVNYNVAPQRGVVQPQMLGYNFINSNPHTQRQGEMRGWGRGRGGAGGR